MKYEPIHENMAITYGGAGWGFSRILKDERTFRCLSNFAREVFSKRRRLFGVSLVHVMYAVR